jgi:serine/threonine protein phosphatase PrpC
LAVRLALKLGAVTDHDRLPDSPDAVVIVEPTVGSVARTKGSLFLLVDSTVPGSRAREAARLVADAIRDDYYYDESAGIRQCLTKAISTANKRLAHQRDRFGLGHAGEDHGPVGVAVAVVRGRELYVATVGPAQAYLIRQARLSTLPDPYAERGLPAAELEPEVWRGELAVGDSLCLVSAQLVAKVGTDGLKDALVTLHPQAAVEHLHGLYAAAGGTGSDAVLAFEVTEEGATYRSRALVPVRPATPLAGAPERSPIPLADSVTARAAAVTAGANRARDAAGNSFTRLIWRIQDRLPHRGGSGGRTTTASTRAELQRRAAVALISLVAVAGLLVLGVYVYGGQHESPGQVIPSFTVAQASYDAASAAVAKVSGGGVDLIRDDPRQALALLRGAFADLAKAENAGYPKAKVVALRAVVMDGLDRLYGAVKVASSAVFTFPDAAGPVRLTKLVRGSDGAPYVLDTGTGTVWRIDLAKKTASPILKAGQKAASGDVGDPVVLMTGGPDVLVLDSRNQLWRWRPADNTGKGTLRKIIVKDAANWGTDITVAATFVSNFNAMLYKLYVVDPSYKNIRVLSPAGDGSGYFEGPQPRLPADRDVSSLTELLIDGDIYATENGVVKRLSPSTSWATETLADQDVRPGSSFTHIVAPDVTAGSPSRGTGSLYAYDALNHRIVAFAKADGVYIAQYRPADGVEAWTGLVDFLVLPPGADAAPTAWWIDPTGLHTSLLLAVPTGPGASPSPTPEPTASPVPTKTPKPGKTPKPTKKP